LVRSIVFDADHGGKPTSILFGNFPIYVIHATLDRDTDHGVEQAIRRQPSACFAGVHGLHADLGRTASELLYQLGDLISGAAGWSDLPGYTS
jgi:hypothetical protein